MGISNNRRSTERQSWIDVLKFIAIAAVFVDHTSGFLYTSPYIAYASYFSVTVFIFLSGVTAFDSNIRRMNEPFVKNVWRKLRNILIPYAMCTSVYMYPAGGGNRPKELSICSG